METFKVVLFFVSCLAGSGDGGSALQGGAREGATVLGSGC